MPFTWQFYPFVLSWPRLLNRDRTWSWDIAASTATGGKSLSGLSQSARLDGGGYWVAEMGDVQVSSADQVRAWLALAARLDNGATPVVLEARNERITNWPIVNGAQLVSNDTPCSDGATCDDGATFDGDSIEAVLFANASLRQTIVSIAVKAGAALRGGEMFSIQHNVMSHRLYKIGKIVESDKYPRTAAAVTVTIASPGVFTWANHGLVADQAVFFTTLGALPTGLSPLTLYYVVGASITTNTFQVAATVGGSAINTSGSQSGTHTGFSGGTCSVTIRPPLREATLAGKRLEFDNPKCIMHLAKPDAMKLALQRRFHGQATVQFVEDFPPWDSTDLA